MPAVAADGGEVVAGLFAQGTNRMGLQASGSDLLRGETDPPGMSAAHRPANGAHLFTVAVKNDPTLAAVEFNARQICDRNFFHCLLATREKRPPIHGAAMAAF